MNIYKVGLVCGTYKQIEADVATMDDNDNMLFMVDDEPIFHLAAGRWDYVELIKKGEEEKDGNENASENF